MAEITSIEITPVEWTPAVPRRTIPLQYGGTAPGTTIVSPATSVWVRLPGPRILQDGIVRWWGAEESQPEWIWVPWLYPETAKESVAPQIPRATIYMDYGRIKQPQLNALAVRDPLNIPGGSQIAIMTHSVYGSQSIWTGVVPTEHVRMEGIPDYAQGRQTWQGFGLEYILDRRDVVGSHTEDGFIDRGIAFNKRDKYGIGWIGNRSTDAVDGQTTVFDFSRDGEVWTNLDILRYLLHFYSPLVVTLAGRFAQLDDIVDVHNFDGMTVFQAISQLIPRFRGLGWRLLPGVTDGIINGELYLDIFSLLSDPISYFDFELPGNNRQAELHMDGNVWDDATLRYTDLAAFNSVRVEGGHIGVCFSLSPADGTLEEGWDSGDETDYLAGAGDGSDDELNDAERTTDKFIDVFSKFQPPADWDWQILDGEGGGVARNVVPTVNEDGSLDFDTLPGTWQGGGASFERSIPLYVTTADGESEPRRPFLVIKHANKWYYVDKMEAIDERGAHFTVADNKLGIKITSVDVPHRFALNHFGGAEGSLVDPVFDWEDVIATVFLKTDQRLAVTLDIPGVSGMASVKRIKHHDSEMWVVLENTIMDVVDGELLTLEDQDPLVYDAIRDDTAVLQKLAVFAAAYYGQQRATLSVQTQAFSMAFPPGSLVRGVYHSGYYMFAGTVVTERTWTFGANMSTSIRTGFEELEMLGR